MRSILLLLAVATGCLAFAGPSSACSIRGGYCGYPSWAANAFEGRYGYKGNPRILTEYYPGKSEPRPYARKERSRHR